MTSLSRRTFFSSVLKAGLVVYAGSIVPAYSQAPSLKLLSRDVILDKDNPWGLKRVSLLKKVLQPEGCDHIDLTPLQTASRIEKIAGVNKLVNEVPYVTDQKQFGLQDVWAAPHDFFLKGGDCEDFALAKFGALAHLGIHPDDMYIMGLYNRHTQDAHASLGVKLGSSLLVLDNMREIPVMEQEYQKDYKLAYALNTAGLWKPVS